MPSIAGLLLAAVGFAAWAVFSGLPVHRTSDGLSGAKRHDRIMPLEQDAARL